MDSITVVSAEIRPQRVNIRTALGTIDRGWSVMVQLRSGEHTTLWKAVNLCETDMQGEAWCREQCQAFVEQLGSAPSIEALVKLACPRAVIAELGFPIPPDRPWWTDAQALAYNARTGRPGVDGFDEVYAAYVTEYNAWIAAHSILAVALGCSPQ